VCDAAYKRLFSHAEGIESLARCFAAGSFPDIGFSTLGKAASELTGEAMVMALRPRRSGASANGAGYG